MRAWPSASRCVSGPEVIYVAMVVLAPAQVSPRAADAWDMAPVTTRSAPALTPALDAALEQLDALAASPVGQVPTMTTVVLDRDLRVRLAAGLGWMELGVDPEMLIGQ